MRNLQKRNLKDLLHKASDKSHHDDFGDDDDDES